MHRVPWVHLTELKHAMFGLLNTLLYIIILQSVCLTRQVYYIDQYYYVSWTANCLLDSVSRAVITCNYVAIEYVTSSVKFIQYA